MEKQIPTPSSLLVPERRKEKEGQCMGEFRVGPREPHPLLFL